MLVRELIEQLAEMPQEVPVYARLWFEDPVDVHGAVNGNRETGVGVFLALDSRQLQLSYSDYANEQRDDTD